MSRSGNLIVRIGAVLLLLGATVLAPWWGTVVLTAAYAILFRFFLEGVLVGWLIDSIFATGLPWITIGVIVYVVAVELVAYYVSH